VLSRHNYPSHSSIAAVSVVLIEWGGYCLGPVYGVGSHASPPNPCTGQVKPDFPLLIHNGILHTKPKTVSASLFKKEGKGMKWMKEKVEQDPQPRIMSCEIDLQAQSKEQTKRKHQKGRRDNRNSKQRCLFFKVHFFFCNRVW